MLKKWLVISLLCCIVASVLAACGNAGSPSNTPATGNVIHMSDNTFVQTSISIKKGESITLASDTFTPHIISNGAWENGSAKPAKENGAPTVQEMHIDGNSQANIGPFNTAGTFKFYCTIHGNMNLLVTVA